MPISLATLLKGQHEFFLRNNFEVLTASADGPEVKQILQAGVGHQVIPMTRQITPWRDLQALFQLIRLIKEFKPNIVHTHTPKAGLLGMLAAFICKVPVRMHTIAGLPWMEAKGVKKKLLKITERVTYSCSTGVYPNSFQLRDFLKHELKFKADKMRVIGHGSSNGIDVRHFSREAITEQKLIREKLDIAADDFVFCFIGRLVRDKGISELVDAFQRLAHTNAWLLLVGHQEPDLDPLPAATLSAIKNNRRIIEAGFQADVRPWLTASDVFVFPSYREGFPNVVMQAACMELPCIVSNINGCTEIIQHGQSGLIVPVKDVHALRYAMEQMAIDKSSASQMGKIGRAYVAAHFDQQVVWNELLNEYKRNLDKVDVR